MTATTKTLPARARSGGVATRKVLNSGTKAGVSLVKTGIGSLASFFIGLAVGEDEKPVRAPRKPAAKKVAAPKTAAKTKAATK